MTIIRPDQLFDLADRLLTESGGQQVYLRRSISSAYYGLFHSVAITIADHVAGAVRRQSAEWSLAARSIGHTKLNNVCQEILKPKPVARYRPYILPMTFGADMRGFCGAFIELQESGTRLTTIMRSRSRLLKSEPYSRPAALRLVVLE